MAAERRVTVQVTLVVDVMMPAEPSGLGESWTDWMDYARFSIEENSCPGTSRVGAALESAIEHGNEHSVCWGCNLHGQNKIIAVDGKPVTDGT